MRSIVRKLSLLAGCIALIAMALPTVASAVELQPESEPGVPVPAGTWISLQGGYMSLNDTWWADLECSDPEFESQLEHNGAETVALSGSAGAVKECEAAGEGTTLEGLTLESLSLGEAGSGDISLYFTWRVGPFECPYEAEGAVSYEAGTDVVSLDKVPVESDFEFCEAEGGGQTTLSADLSLSLLTGEPVLVVEATPKWTVQSTPSTGFGGLQDVSCPSAEACFAVGFSEGALAERWSGGEWTTTPVSGGALSDVSCASNWFCVAIPEGLGAQRWTGSKWSSITAVTPSGASSPKLNGVSCGSPTSCIAVGRYVNSSGKARTLAEKYDGTSWTVLTTPSEEGGGNSLNAVSCTSASSCTAIGSAGGKPLALRWNGSEWSTLAAPNQVAAATYADLSCVSASSCMAVGQGYGKAERWNGSEWISAPIAKPEDGEGSELLQGVSCVSAECIAVGQYESGISGFEVLAERWNGSEWEVQKAADPFPEIPELESELIGVSCSAVSRCTAVGYAAEPLVERYQ